MVASTALLSHHTVKTSPHRSCHFPSDITSRFSFDAYGRALVRGCPFSSSKQIQGLIGFQPASSRCITIIHL
jgi:hypothetical protein